MKHINIIKLLVVVILTFLSISSHSKTITYSCDYKSYSDEEGIHKVSTKLELNFIYDDKTKKSYMLGNNGSSEVGTFQYSDHVVFVEITPLGSFQTTTIDKNLNSVHSRNTVMSGKIVASQYYGSCVVK